MIRIRRGPEPTGLREVRLAELARIRPLTLGRSLTRIDLGRRYAIVKEELRSAQHYKCCYCEKNNLEAPHSDVEHFRPAIRARRGVGFPEHGYWWLAWTWGNLMFACKNCNESAKIDQFPLVAGSQVLLPENKSIRSENPLLLDPCHDNPLRHIQFRPVPQQGRTRWIPMARNGSIRGFETIKVLKLNRPDLLDLYDRHVKQYVTPLETRIQTAIREANQNRILDLWLNDVLALILPDRPFTALSHDAFDFYISAKLRRKWGLKLLQPR